MYIKLKIEKIVSGEISTIVDKELSTLMAKHDIHIHQGADLGNHCLWKDIEGYRYIKLVPFDLRNRNRQEPQTTEEKQDLLKYVKSKGFNNIEALPTYVSLP